MGHQLEERQMKWNALVLGLALLAATACAMPSDRCGTPRPGGGPPILETREQELCENVRLAALRHFAALPDLTSERAEDITRASRRWTTVDSLESLLARLERRQVERP